MKLDPTTQRPEPICSPPLRVRLAAGPRMLLEDLFHLRRRYRRVIPTTATLAERHGVSRPTVKRWLAALRRAGMLVSIYNGGQGRRCVYYVGPRAAQKALEENPAWDLKDAKKATFGALRMGEVCRANRHRKDLKSEILTASDSSSTKRGTPSESPPSENQATEAPAADRDAPPSGPPAGDPLPAVAALAAGSAAVSPSSPPTSEPATRAPKPDEPPTPAQAPVRPPRGAKAPTGACVRARRSIAKDRWDLWCRAWGLWRGYAARARGGPPADHPADIGAMKSLLSSALLRHGGNEDLALDDLAWGFRAYIRDPRDRFKPLGRLARTRSEYGRPPPTFQAPWRREDASAGQAPPAVARIGASSPGAPSGPATGRIAGGGAPSSAPRPKLSIVELARLDVKRAIEAQSLGIGSPRAVERALKLLDELERKQAKDRPK